MSKKTTGRASAVRERMAAARVDTGSLVSEVQGAAAPAKPAPRRKAKRASHGPRGGETTITAGGLLRATVYLEPAVWHELRERGLRQGKTAAELVRVAVDRYVAK